MKQKSKKIFLLAIVVVLIVLGVQQIVKGIQEAVAYYERHDKYVTVEGKVHSVYRFGLGYTARVCPSSNGILRIFFGMLILAAMGYFIYGYKNHKYEEISINISTRAKKVVRVAGVILAAWIVANGAVVLVSSYFDARNDDWGMKLSVSDVSSKGLTLHLERSDAKNEEIVSYGSAFFIQRRTLIGWKEVIPNDGYVFTSEGYSLGKMDSKSMDINLEGWFGRLPMGIYRINKTTSVNIYKRNPGDERVYSKQELYATFVVIW